MEAVECEFSGMELIDDKFDAELDSVGDLKLNAHLKKEEEEQRRLRKLWNSSDKSFRSGFKTAAERCQSCDSRSKSTFK